MIELGNVNTVVLAVVTCSLNRVYKLVAGHVLANDIVAVPLTAIVWKCPCVQSTWKLAPVEIVPKSYLVSTACNNCGCVI